MLDWKKIFLTLVLVFSAHPANAASALLPIHARIINLTQMPIEEAIAFCDERGMACPALREKQQQQLAQDASYGDSAKNTEEAAFDTTGKIRTNEDGYYME